MKLRVYLVEDSPIICKLLRELIEGTDETVIGEADSAEAAIDEICELSPDVVLVDIALREGSGFNVLEGLRSRLGSRAPIAMVLTNYTLPGHRALAQRCGADHFFDKSNQIPEMLRVLRSIAHPANRANGDSGRG